jgi:hypothetical protein
MGGGLPKRERGKQSPAAQAKYEADLRDFCETITQIASTLDFRVSSRGWGYILEQRGDITKGELDAAQKVIQRLPQERVSPFKDMRGRRIARMRSS